PAVAGCGVAGKEAVAKVQNAQPVPVAEAATRRAGGVILKGAVGNGDRAVAVVTNAARETNYREGRVVAHDRAVHDEVGAVVADRVKPNAAALVVGEIAEDHRAVVNEDAARAVGEHAAPRVAHAVVADRAVT